MNPPENDFYNRKLEHIKSDYDHVFSAILKFADHGKSVRQWNIGVIVAYLGLVKACVDKGTEIPILPLIGAVYLFWVMEAFVKAQRCLYEDYLEAVDRLLSEKDDGCFKQLVEKYRFPRTDKNSPAKDWWVKGGRFHRFFRGLVNCQTLVFHALPLLVILIVWYRPSRNQFTFSVPLSALLLLPAVLFLVFGLIYWWKYRKEELQTGTQSDGSPDKK